MSPTDVFLYVMSACTVLLTVAGSIRLLFGRLALQRRRVPSATNRQVLNESGDLVSRLEEYQKTRYSSPIRHVTTGQTVRRTSEDD